MRIERYLHYKYKQCARGEDGYIDCWGLTRLARHELYGKPLLPSFAGAKYDQKAVINSAVVQETSKAERVPHRRDGAVVLVVRFGLCIHTALVCGDHVLEIKRAGQKARLTPWREFVLQYPPPMWELQFYD